MKEMQFYLKLLEALRTVWPERRLTLSERGCLAMAAQWLSGQSPETRELYLRHVNRVTTGKSVSDTCYLILDMALRDYRQRIRPTDQGQEALIENVYRVKARAAYDGGLKDFILTGQYRYFPDFFRQYDALTHA